MTNDLLREKVASIKKVEAGIHHAIHVTLSSGKSLLLHFGPLYRQFNDIESLYKEADAIIEDDSSIQDYSDSGSLIQFETPVPLRLVLQAGLDFGKKSDYNLLLNNCRDFASRICSFSYIEALNAIA